jgi:hypothetical protein
MRRETASRGFLPADMYKFEIAPSDSIAEKEIQIEFQRWLGDGVWSVATAFNLPMACTCAILLLSVR